MKEKNVRAERLKRVEKANKLLLCIASCGRKFFSHESARRRYRVSYFHLADNGRVWFVDKWTEKSIYTHYKGEWRSFSEGGTLKSLIERLRDFIMVGKQLPPRVFGPWPLSCCGGDLWGYGADMQIVRDKAASLGIVTAEGGQ